MCLVCSLCSEDSPCPSPLVFPSAPAPPARTPHQKLSKKALTDILLHTPAGMLNIKRHLNQEFAQGLIKPSLTVLTRDHPFLQALPRPVLDRLHTLLQPAVYEPRAPIVTRGEPVKAIYFLGDECLGIESVNAGALMWRHTVQTTEYTECWVLPLTEAAKGLSEDTDATGAARLLLNQITGLLHSQTEFQRKEEFRLRAAERQKALRASHYSKQIQEMKHPLDIVT